MRPIIKTVLPLLLFTAGNAAADPLWSDEFDGANLNTEVWSYDLGAGGWGNSEIQEYTNDSSNVRVENGVLVINAHEKTQRGKRKSYTSGRIKSENRLTVKYGTIEARIKVPDLADGLWPAFWTLGNNFQDVGWPDSGELDIMEMGSAAAIDAGVVNRRVGSTAHWEHNGTHAEYGLSYDSPTDLHTDFHVFRMEWTPDLVSTYVDNQWIWSIDISEASCPDCTEFHQPHFIILNLAVGGLYTGITRSSEVTAPMPAEMLVDYVRIYDNGFTELGGSAIDGGGGGGNEGTQTYVAAITPGVSGGGPNKRARADVLIMDETGEPVESATVTVTFTGSHNGTLTSLTDASGNASFTTSERNRTVAFEVCVDSVTHATMTYTPAANIETCDAY